VSRDARLALACLYSAVAIAIAVLLPIGRFYVVALLVIAMAVMLAAILSYGME
jgi:hypothetical protein